MTIENEDNQRTEAEAVSYLHCSIFVEQISCRSPQFGRECGQPCWQHCLIPPFGFLVSTEFTSVNIYAPFCRARRCIASHLGNAKKSKIAVI